MIKNGQQYPLQLLVHVDLDSLEPGDELGLGQHAVFVALVEHAEKLVDREAFPLLDIGRDVLKRLLLDLLPHRLALVDSLHDRAHFDLLNVPLQLVEACDAVHRGVVSLRGVQQLQQAIELDYRDVLIRITSI